MIDLEQVRSGLANREDASLPLAERAYRHLLHEIIRLSLRPGQILRETELQQQLGMGRTPIREALLRLSGDKLVTIHPRRGTFVSDMNVTDLGAVYEVRADLESLAAKLAAERSGDEEVLGLADIRRQLPAIVERSDQDGLMAVDLYLHRLVYRLARNEFLVSTLEHYLNLSTRLACGAVDRAGTGSLDWLADALLEFVPLLQAIEEHRPEVAMVAARHHAAAVEANVRQRV